MCNLGQLLLKTTLLKGIHGNHSVLDASQTEIILIRFLRFNS